jgi:ankyrin repeat protein
LIYLISASITPTNEDPSQIILDKLAESVASLFCNEDFRPTLRICRPFIRNRPELLHAAISNNHSDLVPKFIAIATIDLLREKNQLGETTLLHAARLNRIDIIRAILKKQNSDKLLEDINDQGQNVFHLLALNNNSDAILHLMINHLLKNSIDIQEKFDHVDADNQTPLQLAISNNNLLAIDHLLKYFNNDIHVKNNHAVDDLIERVLLSMIE